MYSVKRISKNEKLNGDLTGQKEQSTTDIFCCQLASVYLALDIYTKRSKPINPNTCKNYRNSKSALQLDQNHLLLIKCSFFYFLYII